MACRKTVPLPKHCRRSLDQGAPAVTPAFSLRQERSSPAVVQQIDSSLVRTIVSASGTGLVLLLKSPSSANAVWRTRSVRNKTESYCILQLKQPARGITVQITFTSAATTPREIRLLHALAVNGTFKPLTAQHCLNSTGGQQVQHSLAVSPSIQVQHYLKLEMQGQAVAATTGACHAVCQLDVMQPSALATTLAARATPLSVPEFESPAPTTVTDISADVLLASPTGEGVQDFTSNIGAQQLQTAAVQQQQSVQQQHMQQQQQQQQCMNASEASRDSQRFNSWLDQTRSSLQHSRRNSGSLSSAAAPASDDRCLQPGQPDQLPPAPQPDTQAKKPTAGEPTAFAARIAHTQHDQQPQQHHHTEQQPCTDLQVTLEANRQQLLQLQKQYQLLSSVNPPRQESVDGDMQPHTVQRQLLLGMPRSQALVHASAAVLTAAGRPSTVLSMLNRSDSWSDEPNGNDSSSTLSASMDNSFCKETCITPEVPVAAARGVAGTCVEVASAGGAQTEPIAGTAEQQWQQASNQQDESAVLMGSLIYEPGFSVDSHMSPAPPAITAEDTAADGCSSSHSVVGPCGGQDNYMEDLLDETSSLGGNSIANPMFDDMRASIMQLAVTASSRGGLEGFQGPVLVDSQSCLPANSNRPYRSHGQAEGSPTADRKIQSCPAISPRLASSTAPSNNELAAGPFRTGCRPHTTGSSHQQVLRTPRGAATLLEAAAGVTLSPEVMRRGQLVKQSCPTFSFPRYNSHSPAKLSKEYVASTAAAEAAQGDENIDEDHEPAVSVRRSRLAHASNSSDWQQQPVRALFRDAEEHAVANSFGSMQAPSVTAHPSADGDAGPGAATRDNASIVFSPIFEPQQLLTSSEGNAQHSEQQANALLGTVPPQQMPVQQNNHKLLQALLFSSCDYGSSMDLGQAAAHQQGLLEVSQPEYGGFNSPNQLQHHLFWDQQRDQQQKAAGDGAQGRLSALVATSAPQLTQAIGGINLSPIAESPEVTKPVAGPGSDLGRSSAGSESKAKPRLAVAAAAAACNERHDLQQTDQQKQQQVPQSLQQLLALSQKAADVQPIYQLQQHQQVLQEQLQFERRQSEQEPQQPLQEKPASDQQLQQPPPPQHTGSAECTYQQHVSSLSVSRSSDLHRDRSGQSELYVRVQSASLAADPAVVAGRFSRAAGRSGGPAGYHRMSNKQQRNSTGSLDRTTLATQNDPAAVATIGASAASGSITARSADVPLRPSVQQQQQHRLGSLRASIVRTSSQISRPAPQAVAAAAAAATAGSKTISNSTRASTWRRHSAGHLTARTAQADAARASYLKLDLLPAAGPGKLRSMVGAGGSSSTAAETAGSAASGKARAAAKYEQLLQSQFGKPLPSRSSQPGSSASRQAQSLATQMAASGTGPVTTSLCLADLFATDSNQSAQHQTNSPTPLAAAVQAASNSSDSLVAVEQLQLCLGDMVPCVGAALQQAASNAVNRGTHDAGKPYQLQRPSSRQWRDNQVQPAQLPFAQQVKTPAAGCSQPPHRQHLQPSMLVGWQQQQQDAAHNGCCQPAANPGAGTLPASPNQQLNLFLPKLIQPQLLTPNTEGQPGRHFDSAGLRIEDSRSARDVHRGPSPSTPSWLGMASPKSGTKQPRVHDKTRQQDSTQQDCHQDAGQEPLQLRQQIVGHPPKSLQAANAKQVLVLSIDAAIKAASGSPGAPSQRSSIGSAGSSAQQHSPVQQSSAAEAEISSTPAADPAPAGEINPDRGAANAIQQQAQEDAAPAERFTAQVPPAVRATACSSPTRVLCRPLARSCPLIASPIRASQVARKGPAVISSYQLQTVCLDALGTTCSGSVAGVPVPAQLAVTLPRPLTDASNKPARSTIIVSIVKHARSGQQQQVQLQQRYVFEAQPIQDVVQLDAAAGVDSCASCTSSTAPADAGFDSVQAQVYNGQYEAAATSPAGTEVSMAVHRLAAVDPELAAAAAAAHEEEVASSNEPVGGQSGAGVSVGASAAGCATSPGSCGSAISSTSAQHKKRGAPGHLIRQAAGQPKSRLGPHQLAVASSAAGASGRDGTPASSGSNQHPQQQHSIVGLAPSEHVASSGPADEQQTAGVAATAAVSEAAGQRADSSPDSFCTASSQMGTVWPHEHCHNTECGALAASDPSASSGSSVSDTCLQRIGLAGDKHCQTSNNLQQRHEAAPQTAADRDAVLGVQLARNFYHRSSQHSGQSSAAPSSKPISHRCSHGDAAVAQSLSGTHSLWDETDPVEDDAIAADAGGTPTMAQVHSSIRASQLQVQQMPHRVTNDVTDSRTSKEKHIQQAGPTRCSAGAAGGGGRVLRGSIHGSTNHGSMLSDVSVVSDADSASSAAGPPQQRVTAAASAAENESQGSAAGSTHLQQHQHEGLQLQQQHDQADKDSAAEQVASTSLSFAVMHTPQSGYSSHHSTPGMSSTAAASAAPKQPVAAEGAAEDLAPICPAARQAARHEPAAASLDGSVGSSGFQPMQAGPSADDVAAGDSQQAASSKKDQSPSKASNRDQPDKLPTSKPAASPGSVVTSHATSRWNAAVALTPKDQYVDEEDVASSNSKGSYQQEAAAAHKPAGVEQQQQQAPPGLPTHSEPRTRPRLQVVVPGSPKVVRTAVCFSPLHAARASRGSLGSLAPGISSPGRQTAPVAPFAQVSAVIPAVIQPSLSGDSTTAPAAAQITAAAAAAAGSNSTKQQPVSAGAVSPYTGFSPLHSMLHGSGSDGRISSKTHSRTRKGLPGQEDDVTMVRKNLMDDMIRAAAGGEVPAILGYAVVAEKSDQLPDTYGVRDSKLGAAAAAGRIMGFEQPGAILHTPLRPHKGSVLDQVSLQLPVVGVSPLPQQQQQVTGLRSSSTSLSVQQLQGSSSELPQAQLEQPTEAGLVAEGSLMQQWCSEVLPQVSSRSVASESGLLDSVHLLSQSSAAAADAMRAAAATPALIPSHCSQVAGGVEQAQTDKPGLAKPQQQQHNLGAEAATDNKGLTAGSSLAVISVDAAIPPVSAAIAPQKSIPAQLQPGMAGGSTNKQQHTCVIKPAAAAPSSDGKVTSGAAGPLSSALRRHNSAGALARMQTASTPASGLAGALSREDSTQAASSTASAGDSGVASEVPAEAIGQSPGVCEVLLPADRGKQPTAAGARTAGSPYLQQLQEHSAQAQQQQQQQLRGVTASPLSMHRHQLSFKKQQLVSPGPHVPDAAAAASTTTAPPSVQARPASSLGHHSPVTPLRPSCCSSQQTGDVYVSAGTAAAAVDAGQVPGVVTRGSSCSGRLSPTADGANSGAARMGRLRHRRARSDMPEYYPLSPLESPLHTAMPEDLLNECEITLSPQVSAAAAAALAAAETPEAGAHGEGGLRKLLVVQTAVEPAAGPLGSPLRHGLLSPAAMYRIQQQQLKEQASQQQLGAEQSTALLTSPKLSPAVSREPSKADVQQKEHGVAQAVADAVAAYEGSISPRRLAKIQEYVSGLVAADVGGSILDQSTPQHKVVADVRAASTPGKDSDAFDSFNLNNHLNLQAELEQHGHQLELQQHSGDRDHQPVQQLEDLQLEVPGASLSQQQPLIVNDLAQQLQDQLTPQQELSGILSARLSKCSSSTVRASVEALLAAKMRVSSSSTRSQCSSGHEPVASAAAGEGDCATAVAQLLQASAEPLLPLVQSEVSELPCQHSGGHNSSRSYAGCIAASEHSGRCLHHLQQPPLTAATLRQHSLGSSGSHQGSNQRYPLHGELSYASSAAASHAELLQAAAMATAAGDKLLLTSIQELLEAPALLSASTETTDLHAVQEAGSDQLSWPGAIAQCAGSRRSLGHLQSQDSQQEAVMQSHGALLGPGLTEISTAACGAVAGGHRPASAAPRAAAAAPAGHALAGGMFRRSAQLLAGLANGLMQPTDVGSVESTAGSMAIGSSAPGPRATGDLRQSHGFDRVGDDEEFSKQLKASVNMVAGSLDISGPQVVRLTQQLWLNRLLPDSVAEGESSQATPATAGPTFRSTTTGSGSDHSAALHQTQQQVGLGPHQPARGTHGCAPQAQMGPLLAGRLAAMAAMRQLRRSSVGESPDIVGNGRNLASSRRSLASLLGPAGQAGYRGSTASSSIACTEGLDTSAEAGIAEDAQGSVYAELHAAAHAVGGGIGRGRLSAAEATAAGALTSSNSFGSGGILCVVPEAQQCQQPLVRQLPIRRGQQEADRRNAMRESVASLVSNEDGFYD